MFEVKWYLVINLAEKGIDTRKLLSKLFLTVTLLSLIIFVFLPTFYLISFTFVEWNEVYREVFANPIIGDEHWQQIKGILTFSFRIALVSVLIDMLIGIPLGYILARKQFPGKGLLEDLVTLPLVIPTSAFGFATLITWTTVAGIGGLLGLGRGLVEQNYVVPIIKIPFLILIVHVTLTFPYVVRIFQSKLEELNPEFEVASRSLGASVFTTFRTIVFPQALPGLFSGGVLAFARSLGETGATMIVAGVSTTASIAIVRWEFEFKIAPASFLGFLLIIIATSLILPVEYFVSRERSGTSIPNITEILRLEKYLLKLEKTISRKLHWVKEIVSFIFIVICVILPIFVVLNSVILYWHIDPFTGRPEGGVLYQLFGPPNYFQALMRATLISFTVATISTYISVCIGIATTIIIEKYRFCRVIRSLLKIPLVVPTSALGLSMILLWGTKGLSFVNPGIWLIILTHIVFSVPVIVESTLASYEGSEVEVYEEAARSLGATPYDVAETIILPVIKRGILTGAILSFTHSLGETGATFIVMGRDTTVSTLVISMAEAQKIPAALFASTYLLALSLILLFIFRKLSKG